ncbi:MAG: hypothetical protein AB1689_15805 [Thermodesulfobacteriota bacterium]
MERQTLRSLAAREGFEETTCPSCEGRDDVAPCPNCGGSGRLWVSGARSLSDAGLRRLLGMAAGGPHVASREAVGERADLHVERAFLATVQRTLYELHGDLVVVIRERSVVGVFPDLRTAETEARIRFGRTPVLIERLGVPPRPLTNAPAARRRDLERLRTLRDALREVLRASRQDPEEPDPEPKPGE